MPLGGGGASSGAIEAGRAFVRLFADRTDLEAGLRQAQRSLAAFGRSTARAGAVLFAGAGTAALTFGKLAEDTLGDLAKTGEIAAALGTPVEKLSGLFGVMKAAGSPLKESIESISQFGTAVTNAVEGKGENPAELFRLLNRNAADFKRLDPAEGIYQMFDALKAVENPLDKARALSLAFGTDGMKLLLPMLNRSSAELREQARLYAVTADDTAAARTASVAYAEAVAKLTRAWEQVAIAAAPTLTQVADLTGRAAVAAKEFVQANQTLVAWVAVGTAGAAALGAAMIGVGTAASLASVAFGKLAVVVGAALTPAGAVVAAVAGLGAGLASLYATQTAEGQRFTAQLGAGFAGLRDTAEDAFAGITAAVAGGDWRAAGEIAMAGLNAAWTAGLHVLQQGWTAFKDFFVDGWHDAVKLIALGFVGLFEAVSGQLGGFVTKLNEVWNRLPGWAKTVLDPTGLGAAALGAAADVASGNADDIRNQIEKDAARGQADRDESRAAALDGTRAAAEAARAELARLSEKAQYGGSGGSFDKEPQKYAPQVANLDKTLGQFLGGASATQVFGQGGDVQKQQLDTQKRIADGVKDGVEATEKNTDAVNRLAGALTFK